MQHSGVEVTPSQKNDSLSEEQDGAHKAGKNDHESAGRQASRSAGFHQGQVRLLVAVAELLDDV